MLVTLQQGCDDFLWQRAKAECGLEPELLRWVLESRHLDQAARNAEAEEYQATLAHEGESGDAEPLEEQRWWKVREDLRELDERFWREVELDIDRAAQEGGKGLLTFTDGIPEDPKQARVTRTSLAVLLDKKLRATSSAKSETAGTNDPETQPFTRKDRYSAKMLALAARAVVADDESMRNKDKDGSPNRDSIAHSWLAHLQDNENTTGLTANNISRHISEGLDLL